MSWAYQLKETAVSVLFAGEDARQASINDLRESIALAMIDGYRFPDGSKPDMDYVIGLLYALRGFELYSDYNLERRSRLYRAEAEFREAAYLFAQNDYSHEEFALMHRLSCWVKCVYEQFPSIFRPERMAVLQFYIKEFHEEPKNLLNSQFLRENTREALQGAVDLIEQFHLLPIEEQED